MDSQNLPLYLKITFHMYYSGQLVGFSENKKQKRKQSQTDTLIEDAKNEELL